MIGLSLQPLYLPWGGGQKFRPPNHLVLLLTSPHLLVTWGHSKSHLINILKDSFIICSLEKSKGSRSSVTGIGTKANFLFLSINHNLMATFWERLISRL